MYGIIILCRYGRNLICVVVVTEPRRRGRHRGERGERLARRARRALLAGRARGRLHQAQARRESHYCRGSWATATGNFMTNGANALSLGDRENWLPGAG